MAKKGQWWLLQVQFCTMLIEALVKIIEALVKMKQ